MASLGALLRLCFLCVVILMAACSSGGEPMDREDQSPPNVSITSSQATQFSEYVLSGEATDDVAIEELAYRVNGSSDLSLLEIDGRFAGFAELEPGVNTIEVEARDAAGNETLETISVVYTPDPDLPDPSEPGGRSAFTVIDQALADGEIDEETAILYRVYAAFGDDRLPNELDVGGLMDAGAVLRDARERFDTLSPEAQQAIGPYFIPPIYEGTWYRDVGVEDSAPIDGPKGNAPLGCEEDPGRYWQYVQTGKIRVWHNTLRPNHGQIAFAVLNALETKAWPKLSALMGRTPPIDSVEQEITQDGCSDHYDVYIVELQPDEQGDLPFWAYTEAHSNSSDCEPWPSYMVVAGNNAVASQRRQYAMAHEFMHSLQYAYRTCLSDALEWITESTAQWAIDYVEPNAIDPVKSPKHFEHLYAHSYFEALDKPLHRGNKDHAYGSYIWPLFITKTQGESFIPQLWNDIGQTRDLPTLLSTMNDLIPGGFHQQFPEFMLRAWNQEPVWTAKPQSNFKTWDSMTVAPSSAMAAGGTEISAHLDGQKDRKILLTLGIQPLAAKVVHIRFDDPKVRSALLSNGYSFELKEGGGFGGQFPQADSTVYASELDEEARKGRHVWALVKRDGSWIEHAYDLTEVAFVTICQDVPDESVEEMILIFTNARWEDTEPAQPVGLAPRIFVSNMGCGAWIGDGSLEVRTNEVGLTQNLDVSFDDLKFTRTTRTITGALSGGSQSNFLGDIIPSKTTRYRLASAEVPWTVSGTRQEGAEVCTLSGSGSFDLADSTSSSLSVDPFLNGSLDMGLIYRSYRIELQFGPSADAVMDSCFGSLPLSVGLSAGPRDTPAGDFLVSEDGQQMQMSWTINDATYTLDLKSAELLEL